MAATGFTPVYLYASGTAGHIPLAANLTNTTNGSEIALNYADGNLFFKNASNSVITTPLLQASGSQNGWLSSTDWTTFNNKAPAFTYTTGYIPFGQGTTTPTQSSSLFWDNTNKALGVGTTSPFTYAQIAAYQSSGACQIAAANAGTTSGDNAILNSKCGSYLSRLIQYGNGPTYLDSNGTTLVLNLSTNNSIQFVTNNTLKAEITNSGNLQFDNATNGITFNSGASALLNDYEVGTWTPVLSTDGTNFTSVSYHSSVYGKYTKIGNLVTVSGLMRTTAVTIGSASGNVIIKGLPYTPVGGSYAVYFGSSSFWVNSTPSSGDLGSGVTYFYPLYRSSSSGTTNGVPYTAVETGSIGNILEFSLSYYVS